MSAPTQHVCLSGFMGTGKTTVGRLLAERAGVAFVDLDARIEADAGLTIVEIFERLGEGRFRALEAAALDKALAAPNPSVLAVGGGTLVRGDNRRAALAAARVLTLTASPETVIARLEGQKRGARRSERPLLAGWSEPVQRAAELLEARRHAYAEAHASLSTESRTPDEVAEEALRAWSERSLLVPLGERSHSVRFVSDLGSALRRALAVLAPTSWFLVTDETVAQTWLPTLQDELGSAGAPAAVVKIPPGEAYKTLSTAERVSKELVQAGADRGSVLVAVGGGVVSDLTGFVAATLLRGVRWLAAPTTTLAMVDASVGGKTGVDLGLAKNAMGAFHQPSEVLIRVAHVETETPRARRSGLSEAIKAGAIGDARLVEDVLARRDGLVSCDHDAVEACVRAALRVKIDIVAADEREAGRRALLNFGHTFGHAIEAAGGFSRWTHGEAVAMGMAAACELGEREGVTDPASAHRLLEALRALALPTDWRESSSEAAAHLHFDKKRRGTSVRVVFLRTLGEAVCKELPLESLRRFMRG